MKDEILDRLAKISAQAKKEDDESAHVEEDALHLDFIEYVMKTGPSELAEMARLVLRSRDIAFARWCA